MLARRLFLSANLARDCRCLLEFVEDAELMFADCGFASAAEMIRKGYELVPEEIDLALEWLKLNPGKKPVPYTKAQALAKEAKAKPLAKHGGERKQGNNVTLVRGNKPGYLLARLARDRPDLLGAFERGEYPSARAAAIAAGIIKPPTPYQVLCRAWEKASGEERHRFWKEVAEDTPYDEGGLPH
jgi:hypothetical protein